MISMRSQFVVILAVAGLLWLPAGSRAQDPPASQRAAATTAPAAFAGIPAGEVVVTYLNGALTVKVNNAPLSKALRAICSQIGAELDFTSGADEEIFADLGPGPAKKVIASLLGGAPYNYVMAQSADDQNSVMNLVVFARTNVSSADNPINQAPRPTRAASIGEKASQQKASDVADMMPDRKMADQLREIEAQIKAAVEPSGDTVTSQNVLQTPTLDPSGPNPPGRLRHRRR